MTKKIGCWIPPGWRMKLWFYFCNLSSLPPKLLRFYLWLAFQIHFIAHWKNKITTIRSFQKRIQPEKFYCNMNFFYTVPNVLICFGTLTNKMKIIKVMEIFWSITWSLEALYIGIVKAMFTGPASLVRFTAISKIDYKKNTNDPQNTENTWTINIYELKRKLFSYHVNPGKMLALHEEYVQTHQQSETIWFFSQRNRI